MNEVQNLLLQIIGAKLFEKTVPIVSDNQLLPLIKESKAQTVFPLFFSALDCQLHEKLTPERYTEQSEDFFRYAIAGTQNFAEHTELHELMTANEIPYVVMKGFASAMYYPEPSLRSMGDIDYLVCPEDLERAKNAVENAGFVIDHGDEGDSIHISYHRPPMSIWELHRTVNGIPSGDVGVKIKAEMDRTIATSELVSKEDVTCRVPNKLHHGLIMLLHTASHLTSEGVGLRHLCDWGVFASSLSDMDFREIFEKKLKSFGLWRFAQVLTLLGINYLDAPKRVWALEAVESHKVDDDTLEELMNDIFSGGNFGTKDRNRYREIKYISDRGQHTVSSDGIIRQGFKTLSEKVRTNHKVIGKHRILYPIGYLSEGGKYIGLLLKGKRKTSGTKRMLKEANERKKIYSSLKLFQ